jgi:hypothetical protein
LARRTYQAGGVYQAGKTRADRWDAAASAYGRFWKDRPSGKKHLASVTLGICRTRSIAERKLAEHIDKLGISSSSQFTQSTSTLTFKRQAEAWLRSLANRKRNPVEETTINNRRYTLDKWIYPFLGSTYLADVNNLALKEFVEHLTAESLVPSSIRDYSNIVKAVVASAIDENVEEKFPRKWNVEFIDASPIDEQRQPTSTSEGFSDMILFAMGQYRMLYALLVGCGSLRANEALGLEIDKHISRAFRTLQVERKTKSGRIYPCLKTKNGRRQVDVCSQLAEMLRGFARERTSGVLFRPSTGAQLFQSNTLSDSLHPILDYIVHERGGFNIFRRFCLTHLETSGCPDALNPLWSRHAHKHVSERYVKLAQDRAFRLSPAEKIGLGFQLSGASNGQLGQLVQSRKAV